MKCNEIQKHYYAWRILLNHLLLMRTQRSFRLCPFYLKHVVHWKPYWEQGMLLMKPLGLAGWAQVVVRADSALEAGSSHWALTSVTGHPRMHHGRMGRRVVRKVMGASMRWATVGGARGHMGGSRRTHVRWSGGRGESTSWEAMSKELSFFLVLLPL